ncbi:MAG: hypothetical protein QOJ52_4188, partial [Acidimicrobiaceae bacterium]|nr:hypothetical protein [Acidimicrobiaceae bacterium]
LALVVSEAFGMFSGLVLTRFAVPLPLVPMRLLRIAFSTAAMALVLLLGEDHLFLTGVPLLAAKIIAGVAIYAGFILLFDIAGLRRSALVFLRATLRRYRDQSTRAKTRASASSLT